MTIQQMLLGSAPPVIGTTWNPSDKAAAITLSNGNLTATGTINAADVDRNARGISGKSSGKWYFECAFSALGTYVGIGVANSTAPLNTTYIGQDVNGWGAFSTGGSYHNAVASVTAIFPTFVANNIIMVALDMDNGKVWMGVNGTWPSSGDPAAGTNYSWNGITGTIYPAIGLKNVLTAAVGTANFGTTPFTYTPPSGFFAWT